jgi:hypothetical protein
MATFLQSNFSQRIFVNIPETDTPITNDNIYEVPAGFYAFITEIQHEGRGFNSANGPTVQYRQIPRSSTYDSYFIATTFATFSTINSGAEIGYTGPGDILQIRTYVDGSGFRRASATARMLFRLEERDRLGYFNGASFFAFNGRITIELYKYP